MTAIVVGTTTATGIDEPHGAPNDPVAADPPARPAAFLVFATWSMAGLFLDGWSHRTNRPESFFTPWHGVLYSGFLAGMAWYAVVAARGARAGGTSAVAGVTLMRRRVSRGESISRIGLVLFLGGGMADAVWHQVFGIEANIGALLSPTHLSLMMGGIALGTGQLVDRWETTADTDPRSIRQTAYGTGLAVAIVIFFTMFLSPMLFRYLPRSEDGQSQLIAGLLVTTVLLVAPMLLLARRWPLPAGSLLLIAAPSAAGLAALDAGRMWATCLAPLIGALAGEAVLARSPGRRLAAGSARALGVVVPLATWSAFYAAHASRGTMRFPAEVWTGSIVLACVVGVGISLLAVPPALGDAAPQDPAHTPPSTG